MAKIMVVTDSNRTPCRVFVDDVELTHKVSNITITRDVDRGTHVVLTFPVDDLKII